MSHVADIASVFVGLILMSLMPKRDRYDTIVYVMTGLLVLPVILERWQVALTATGLAVFGTLLAAASVILELVKR